MKTENINKNQEKLLIIGGTHGNEYTGIDLVNKINQSQISNISTLIANPRAVKMGLRYTETNLQEAFGLQYPISYEERRAKEITPKLKNKYVIDFHNTIDLNMNTGIITCRPNLYHHYICQLFELDNLIIMPAGRSLIGQNSEKSISIEISDRSINEYSVNFFYKKLLEFNFEKLENLDLKKNLKIYEFVANIAKSTIDYHGQEIIGSLENFKALNPKVKELLNLPENEDFYSIFCGALSHIPKGNYCSLVKPFYPKTSNLG